MKTKHQLHPLELRMRMRANLEWHQRCHELFYSENGRLSEQARELRQSMGLSLREVAKKMGISAMFLSDLERGQRLWSEKTASLLCNALCALPHRVTIKNK